MSEPALALSDIDLSDPDLYASGDPHEAWKALRAGDPVHWNPERDGPGFWAVTRYDDACEVFGDPATFSSARGIVLGSHRWEGDPAGGKMLALTDPPRHGKLRRVLAAAFSARVAAELDTALREVIARSIDEAMAAGRCDFVTDLAAKLPITITCTLMGVPRDDWDLMADMTRRAFGSADPEYMTTASARESAGIAHDEILLYYLDLARLRRARPTNDLVSVLANAVIDGAPLSDEEVILNCDNIVVAGNETSRHAAAGGLLALLEHPAAWDALVADGTLIRSAVEEILRWTSPGMHVLRTATDDVTIRGRRIDAGQSVTVWIPSANRDEDAWVDPERFDIARRPNRHLALGAGEHFCIGAPLARLGLVILFEEILHRVSRVELLGPCSRLRSNLIGGYKHVPVRLHPRA